MSKPTLLLLVIGLIITLLCIVLLIVLKPKTSKNNISNSELIDSKKNVEIRILRYDKDLFALDINNLEKGIESLSKIYPPLLIEPNIWTDEAKVKNLKNYLQDTVIQAIYKNVEKQYPHFDPLISELETAFGYYKIYYPEEIIPTIISLIPGIDIAAPSVYIFDNYLYVHIDMYLGAENSLYKAAGLPLYKSERCDPKYLPIDIFKKAIVYKHLAQNTKVTLLEAMIMEGKKLYFTEMMFPQVVEKDIIGYSEEKYVWAESFLGNVWSYLIEKNELFGKGELLMRCYIEEAPFTKSFGNESPGRIGTFIGWKLVQSYMQNNPDITLQQLMKDVDYQNILNKSKFKPTPK